jgi:hypothetical protein
VNPTSISSAKWAVSRLANNLPQIRGRKVLVFQLYVLAVEQRGNDRRVGGRPADAFFFQLAHQRGFRVAGRRLGELLLLVELVQTERLPLLERRQVHHILVFLRRKNVETGEHHALALGPELDAGALGRDRGVFNLGVGHLRGHKARPNQPVQLVLLGRDQRLDSVGGDGRIDRAHGFVGVLRAPLGFEMPGLGRVIVRPPGFFDHGFGRRSGLIRDAHRVGTHIGDQGRGARFAQVHAFIQALGDVHGPLGRVAQALVGGLLQSGGDERRRGRTFALLYFHGGHTEFFPRDALLDGGGFLAVFQGGLLAVDLMMRSALNTGGSPAAKKARINQYSSGTKIRRSASRSTISRRATLCTRPAEMPRLTFFQSSGEIL